MCASRVIGFGTATVDYRIRTADLGIGYTEKLLAQHVEVLGGGAIANCLVQVARLGGAALWLGKLGGDRLAEKIVGRLQEEGVDCSRVIYDSSLSSPFNLAVYAGAQRRRVGGFLLPNSLAQLKESEITELSASVGEGDWVVVEIGEIPLESVLLFCRRVKARGARLAVDVDLDPIRQCGAGLPLVEEVFRLQELIVANRRALESAYGATTAQELAQELGSRFETRIAVTAGAEGCWFAEPAGAVEHLAAIPVEVVDPVGAGDAFHGGLLHGLSTGRDFEQALEMGRRCAALNCLAFGARQGMPTMEQLERFSPEDEDKA
ncbi:MAG: carbohydrate kinase family protein [Spirochaetales bacterium]|nr:carbohydrate kinase family protein [Spirochaetales bacterium]